jgi:hypothetical protein
LLCLSSEEEEDNNMTDFFPRQQQIALTIIPVFTGFLSGIGSACIVYIIMRDRKRKLKQTYHRLLLGMSVSDVINSIRACLSSFFIPVDTPGVWIAYGNQGTCTALGFFAQLGELKRAQT